MNILRPLTELRFNFIDGVNFAITSAVIWRYGWVVAALNFSVFLIISAGLSFLAKQEPKQLRREQP